MAYVNQTRAVTAAPTDRLSGLLATLKGGLARRRVYVQTLRELNALNDRELADLGISKFSIPEIAREAAYGL